MLGHSKRRGERKGRRGDNTSAREMSFGYGSRRHAGGKIPFLLLSIPDCKCFGYRTLYHHLDALHECFVIVSSETHGQRERTCWGIARGEVREKEGGGIIPLPVRCPSATGAVGMLAAKFPSFSFPSRTANASVIEPCIIIWMPCMSVL